VKQQNPQVRTWHILHHGADSATQAMDVPFLPLGQKIGFMLSSTSSNPLSSFKHIKKWQGWIPFGNQT
jgi:hypothetical protein